IGIGNALRLTIDAVPDVTNVQVQVNCVAPALGAEEVERRITFPLEMALAGLPRIAETRSISQFGLSQITLVFSEGTDLHFVRSLVAQRLEAARPAMPPGILPEMGPVTTGLGELYYVFLDNPDLPLMERRHLMDWVVRPNLLTVPGLAEVNTWGGAVRRIEVRLDPDRLRAYGVDVSRVVEAVSQSNSDAGAATISQGGEQRLVRGIGRLEDPDDLRRVVLGTHEGVPVTLGRVASIVDAPMVRQGAITADGRGEQVVAMNLLLIGENGRIVVERVKDRIRSISKSLPEGTRMPGFLDRSKLIERTLETALRNLAEGGALVVVVLFLFLLQLRAGLIVSSMIPVAMLIAVTAMHAFGVSANLMSLGAIDFGLVVDGGVIIVENAVRRLAGHHARTGTSANGEERKAIVLAAAREVLKPSIAGVVIIMAAYLPILALEGVEGKMFRPMGLTVLFALAGALALSLTLVPALCGRFLRADVEQEHPVLHRLEAAYRPLLRATVGRPLVPSIAAACAFALAAWTFPRLGSEFVPQLDEGAIAVEAIYPPSIALDEVIQRATVAEGYLRAQFPDEIAKIVTRIGRPEVATDPMLINQTDIMIELTPPSQWRKARSKAALVDRVAAALDRIPGVETSLTQPIQMRMGEMLAGVGQRSDLGIQLFGPDPAVLARDAAKIVRLVEQVPGAVDVQAESTVGLPQLRITLDREALARYGVRVDAVNDVIAAAVGGAVATTVSDGATRIDVAVRLAPEHRSDSEAIARVPVATSAGALVPLSRLARIEQVEGPIQISRENGQRRIAIQANARGRDLGSLAEDVQQLLERDYHPPVGYRIEYAGTFLQLKSGRARLAVTTPIAFLLIFLLLFSTFGSIRQASLVFTGIPLAITGGVGALALRGMPFSIPAGIGFIALAGIAVLNGVVLVSFINDLRANGTPLRDAVVEGAVARLRPVLMTASVAGIGFLPMALATGAGAEVQKPLATVVIGGLLSSTTLTLLVLPSLYAWGERNPEDKAKRGSTA
ncbi:MAG: efflux RND transporter permease subunit, partial [Armatimonadota bacterium]